MSFQEHPMFFTASIKDWLPLLRHKNQKQTILDSLQFLVSNKRVKVYAFVIMPNHLHLIWQNTTNHKYSDVQRDFLKFTAQTIKNDLITANSSLITKLRVDNKDRKYQIWQYKSLSKELYSQTVFLQKLDYIHHNPLQENWKLATDPCDYFYSSAKYYETGISDFQFLSDYRE